MDPRNFVTVTVSCGGLHGDKREFQQFYEILLNNLLMFR